MPVPNKLDIAIEVEDHGTSAMFLRTYAAGFVDKKNRKVGEISTMPGALHITVGDHQYVIGYASLFAAVVDAHEQKENEL